MESVMWTKLSDLALELIELSKNWQVVTDRELEQRFLSIENQLQVNTDTCAAWKASGLTNEEIVKHAVQDEINNKKAEEKDLENRKRNIIIYRAPEKKNENLSERRESDAVFVKDLLD